MKILILTFVLMLLVAGCTQGQTQKPAEKTGEKMEEKKPEEKKDVMTKKEKPDFWIDSPLEGDKLSPGDVTVSLGVKNFKIGTPETANKENEGHFHLFLDNGTYMPCASTTCTVNVGAGEHTIKVTVQNNDHSDYAGTQAKTVTFTVSETASFDILFPKENGAAKPGTVKVELMPKNFKVVAPSTTNNAGEGHFHLFLDNGAYIQCASTECNVQGVTPGSHTIKVEIHNNDHSIYGAIKTVRFVAN